MDAAGQDDGLGQGQAAVRPKEGIGLSQHDAVLIDRLNIGGAPAVRRDIRELARGVIPDLLKAVKARGETRQAQRRRCQGGQQQG